MEDAELEQIRKARLEQLKAQSGGGAGARAGAGAGSSGQAQAEQQKHTPRSPTTVTRPVDSHSTSDTTPRSTPPSSPAQQLREHPTLTRPPTAEARQSILNQILHPEAADRLGRIRLVKEERAADVENRLIMLARSGQLQQKVTEAQLKDLLAAVSANQEKEKIVVSRRKAWEDDDDDLLDL